MEQIEFRCLKCGARVEKNLLPGKHTILGTLPIVTKEASCCEEPRYEDTRGYHRNMVQRSFREMVPGLRT